MSIWDVGGLGAERASLQAACSPSAACPGSCRPQGADGALLLPCRASCYSPYNYTCEVCLPSSWAPACRTSCYIEYNEVSEVSLLPPHPPLPALACLHVGPLVIAREIMGLWSPSLRVSYNLVLYKVWSSPCCASGCYSGFWGGGRGEGWSGEEGACGGWRSIASC